MRFPLIPLCALAGLALAQSPLERARLSAAGLADEIRGLLGEELKKGGFEGAVEACASKAQSATQAFAARERVRIRRVSLKHRNPAGAPDAWERRRLRELEEQQKWGAPPGEVSEEVAAGGVKSLRYLKPITVQPMCLSCHGTADQIPAEVKSILRRRYPDDRATGYKAGELRGAISVVVAPGAQR